tara:strand:+ start:311 stop:595 length:285 start_codon:yes stop_codon:yes gene_type:complete
MNSKNILISIGVIGVGIFLYKVLLGFILPIALFVALGYVLKFLLKGTEADSGEVFSVLNNSDTSSSEDNIVEIKPIEGNKTIDEEKTSFEDKSD